MRPSFLSMAAAVVLLPSTVFALAIGDTIPSQSEKLQNVDGAEITIGEKAGDKGTLVVFTCNHCPYVKAWEDRIAALGNEYGRKGIGVIAINSNNPAKNPDDGFEGMQQRARDKKLEFPYAVDKTSDVAKAFGATKTPEVFLFDAGGKLAYHGAVDDNSESADGVKAHYLKDAMDAVIAGKPASPAETKALGCGIKFR
jgi:thiol-disulfide isomerase/thioredoxin